MIGSTGWVPTLQMSAYVRARPAPGWLGIRMTAGLVADGMVDETCVVWDSRGHLVAQSTQLARLRFPDEGGSTALPGAGAASGGLRLVLLVVGVLFVVGVVAVPRAVALGQRGETGWNRQRGHSSVVTMALSFDVSIVCMVMFLPNPSPASECKRAASRWEAAPRRRDWLRVLYGVGATSPRLSLGIPQICTSDMARRD